MLFELIKNIQSYNHGKNTYRSMMTGSDGVSLRLPQLFLSQHRLKQKNQQNFSNYFVLNSKMINLKFKPFNVCLRCDSMALKPPKNPRAFLFFSKIANLRYSPRIHESAHIHIMPADDKCHKNDTQKKHTYTVYVYKYTHTYPMQYIFMSITQCESAHTYEYIYTQYKGQSAKTHHIGPQSHKDKSHSTLGLCGVTYIDIYFCGYINIPIAYSTPKTHTYTHNPSTHTTRYSRNHSAQMFGARDDDDFGARYWSPRRA